MKSRVVRVHSKIGIQYPDLGRLYYYVRSRDLTGCGWVRIGLEHVKQFFNRSRRTLEQWSKKGKNCGLFIDYEIGKDYIYLKYRNLLEVKTEVVHGGVHSSAGIDVELLRSRVAFLQKVYEIAMLRQQENCRKKIISKDKNKKLFIPPERTKLKRSAKGAKGCAYVSKWKEDETANFFVNPSYEPIGASQITMGLKLGRSRKTVNKWCRGLNKAHIYKRVYKADQSLPGYYYQVTKGKKVLTYRRYPNYYYDPSKGANRLFKEDSDPVVVPHMKRYNDARQVVADFDYLKTIKKPRLTTWEDYLLFNFSKEKLEHIATELVRHFKGREVDFKSLNWTNEQLANGIENAIGTLTFEEQLFWKFCLTRYLNFKNIIPPRLAQGEIWLPNTFKKIAPLNFSSNCTCEHLNKELKVWVKEYYSDFNDEVIESVFH